MCGYFQRPLPCVRPPTVTPLQHRATNIAFWLAFQKLAFFHEETVYLVHESWASIGTSWLATPPVPDCPMLPVQGQVSFLTIWSWITQQHLWFPIYNLYLRPELSFCNQNSTSSFHPHSRVKSSCSCSKVFNKKSASCLWSYVLSTQTSHSSLSSAFSMISIISLAAWPGHRPSPQNSISRSKNTRSVYMASCPVYRRRMWR